MSLRWRLAVAFLCCGLLPLTAAAFLSLWSARSGLDTIQATATDEAQRAAIAHLEGLQTAKKAELERYFATVRDQVVTLAADQMVIDAMRGFREDFCKYREELNYSDADVNKLRDELGTYYNGEFSEEFRKQNEGKQVPAAKFLQQLDADSVALQHSYIRANKHPLGQKHMLDTAGEATNYDRRHAKFHPVMRDYLARFGFYDFFLVTPDTGDVVYSVFKELDFTTSLQDGPYAQTNIADAYRKANAANKQEFAFVDYRMYTPSYDAPASFIAAPIFDGNEKIGVAMFQMPLDRISQIMTARAGLGTTGETIVVGPDGLMRSDSFRDPKNRTVINSFRNPEQGKVCSAETDKAIQLSSAGHVIAADYIGNEVIMAYSPIEILGQKWCLLAKMDTSEAFAFVGELGKNANAINWSILSTVLFVAIVSTALIILIAWVVSGRIAQPIVAASQFAQAIAKGDLSQTCDVKAAAEVGDLIKNMNDMRNGLKSIVQQLSDSASTLGEASGQLSATASQLESGSTETTHQSATVAAAAEQMSTNLKTVTGTVGHVSEHIRMVSAAISQMGATVKEIATSATRSAQVSSEATRLVETSNSRVAELGSAANEIGKVIQVIQDIAEQTNLLALNATIEAARAGEAGKGFAVVASEVKDLARQTTSATDDIRQRIESVQETSRLAVASIKEISDVINRVDEVSRVIASAVEEQSITTREIANSISDTADAADTMARVVNESASASQDITKNISSVDTVCRQNAESAALTQRYGKNLAVLSEELKSVVSQFRA